MRIIDILRHRNLDTDLKFKEHFLKNMEECQWLSNCGKENTLIDFDVNYISTEEELKKCLQNPKWETLCLMKENNFTSFLFLNHKDWYNKNWNKTVCKIRKKYILLTLDESIDRFQDDELKQIVYNNVRGDITFLYMLNIFSNYYIDDFYDKMQKIYLAGHLPCGWVGSLKEGKFLVY